MLSLTMKQLTTELAEAKRAKMGDVARLIQSELDRREAYRYQHRLPSEPIIQVTPRYAEMRTAAHLKDCELTVSEIE